MTMVVEGVLKGFQLEKISRGGSVTCHRSASLSFESGGVNLLAPVRPRISRNKLSFNFLFYALSSCHRKDDGNKVCVHDRDGRDWLLALNLNRRSD